MEHISWASNVNKTILDSAQVTVGENALKQDSLESNRKKTRLSCSLPPKIFQVTMDFDWLEKDINNLTEKDRFLNWYQYKLKYGANCFQFPSVLLGENKGVTEWYRITSAVQGQKSGNSERFTMTWESVFEGTITIPDVSVSLERVSVNKSYIELVFTDVPDLYPTTNDVIIKVDNVAITPLSISCNKNRTRIFISEMASGTRSVSVTYAGKTIVQKISVE